MSQGLHVVSRRSLLTIYSPNFFRSPVLHIASTLFAAIQKSATLQVELITCRPSHHPTSYRISVTALICCLFHSLVGLDTTLFLHCLSLSHNLLPRLFQSLFTFPHCCHCPIDRVCASVSISLYLLPSLEVFPVSPVPFFVALPLRRESLHSAIMCVLYVYRVGQVNKCYSRVSMPLEQILAS